MAELFELRDADAAGRIGRLHLPRADLTVETPALLPVINPNRQTVSPATLAETFGVEMLITNAYILREDDDLRTAALDRGVHDLLGFDGAIMTDSGSFQLAEYGDIDVTTEEIVAFQREIGSDVATPVDLPTPPEADRATAAADVETTAERIATAAAMETGEMVLSAPIQGATYPDLRERAASTAYATGLGIFPVGGVVPLLTAYRFDDAIEAVLAAKRGLGADAPVHLFGAGHPMMFALAVAAGCDLFDSAAYALYARDDRYLTVRGTLRLGNLDVLPCACPACAGWTPAALRELPDADREARLAEHNLHASLAEIRRIRAAIRAGNLLELVETRARAHPAMLDGYRALLEYTDQLERHDPVRKGAFFYLSAESALRPEVDRHHARLDRLAVPATVLLAADPPGAVADDYDAVWRLDPPFGPVPPALEQTYPLTAELPARTDDVARERALEGVVRLAGCNPDAELTVGHRGWPARLFETLPPSVGVVDLEDPAHD